MSLLLRFEGRRIERLIYRRILLLYRLKPLLSLVRHLVWRPRWIPDNFHLSTRHARNSLDRGLHLLAEKLVSWTTLSRQSIFDMHRAFVNRNVVDQSEVDNV